MAPLPSIFFLITRAKLVDYLLNLDHPDGGSKAKFLLGFGFQRYRPDELADALIDHARAGWPGRPSRGRVAVLNVIMGPIRTPIGRNPWICSIWYENRENSEARLVTAYPR